MVVHGVCRAFSERASDFVCPKWPTHPKTAIEHTPNHSHHLKTLQNPHQITHAIRKRFENQYKITHTIENTLKTNTKSLTPSKNTWKADTISLTPSKSMQKHYSKSPTNSKTLGTPTRNHSQNTCGGCASTKGITHMV